MLLYQLDTIILLEIAILKDLEINMNDLNT